MEEIHVDCNHFGNQLLSLWCELLMSYCSVLDKMKVHKKKKCGLLGFNPTPCSLVLTLLIGNFFVKISLQIKHTHTHTKKYRHIIIKTKIKIHARNFFSPPNLKRLVYLPIYIGNYQLMWTMIKQWFTHCVCLKETKCNKPAAHWTVSVT